MKADWVMPAGRGPLALEPAAPVPAGARPAAFLDRDGVINAAVMDPESGKFESPLRLGDVRLLPGVPDALRALADAGYLLGCVSNQPVAAKGKVSLEQLLALHERVLELLEQAGVTVAASRLCPHHPDGVVADFSGPCDCRKPAPGMLLDAAGRLGLDLNASWMIGDTDADVAAGANAGARTLLLDYQPSAHKRSGDARPDLSATDLAHAAAQLLERDPR